MNSRMIWLVPSKIRLMRRSRSRRSLAMRGEAPVPLERLLRDLRINRIFEGTSQIMRLFIAREALDVHLRAAGDVVMPGVPMDRRITGLGRAMRFYTAWYPTRWLGWGRWPAYGAFGPLAGHLRTIERTSRRLARRQFHLMVQHGPALEKRQALLFRCVDIGAELFAMAATCVRAERDRARKPADRTPVELADLFCRHARRRIAALFRAIDSNDDQAGYRLARGVLDERYAWLEEGILSAPDQAAEAEPPLEVAAGR
jgi:alkylation response protein AidB-like acyl-CoA dehydrogenase